MREHKLLFLLLYDFSVLFSFSLDFFRIFAATRLAQHGHEGQILLEKGRLRTLSSASESRKFS